MVAGSFVPAKGKCLLIESGPSHDPTRKHIFIIATDADEHGMHVLFSVCSIDKGAYNDPACEIEVGEHPFVTRRSYILYSQPMDAHHAALKKKVEGWVYEEKSPAADVLLKRILSGALESKHIPRRTRAIIRRALPPDMVAEPKPPTASR